MSKGWYSFRVISDSGTFTTTRGRTSDLALLDGRRECRHSLVSTQFSAVCANGGAPRSEYKYPRRRLSASMDGKIPNRCSMFPSPDVIPHLRPFFNAGCTIHLQPLNVDAQPTATICHRRFYYKHVSKIVSDAAAKLNASPDTSPTTARFLLAAVPCCRFLTIYSNLISLHYPRYKISVGYGDVACL